MRDARKRGRGFIDVRKGSAETMPGAPADSGQTGDMPRGAMTSVDERGAMPAGMSAASESPGEAARTDLPSEGAGGEMPGGSMTQASSGASMSGGGMVMGAPFSSSAVVSPAALELPGTWRLTLTPVAP